MIDAIGKYVGAKVVTALCALGAVLAGIWFWRHPEDLRALWTTVRLSMAWIAFALVLPWTCFPMLGWLLKLESNLAGALLLGGYLLLDVLAALWLAGWHVSGSLAWLVLIVGWLAAAAYNYIICESLARYAER